MSFSLIVNKRIFIAGFFGLALSGANAFAELAFPVVQDINASGGLVFNQTDVFDDTGALEWDETAVYKGNDILVGSLIGVSDYAGLGISVPISNGENGKTSSDGGNNVDIDNPEPVNPAIAAANGGGRLSNGNIIRASVWMRSDPNNPVTGVGSPGASSMPQVEGILKIELWKEAYSVFGDFDPNDGGDPSFGDRIWDQDQQGGAGSFVDMNADGVSGPWGAPVAVTLNTESWSQMVVEYVVDDNPADPGNTFAPWYIAFDQFTVADVEDIRAVFYVGDWTGTDFTGGGSWWMDNFAIEVFADQAAADLVDPLVSNPAPIEFESDFDGDGDVDGADFLGIQQFSPASIATWQADYGTGVGGNLSATSVPEPSTGALLLLAFTCLATRSTKSR